LTVALNETGLLRELIQGHATAFAEIYKRYNQKIFSFAFYLTKSKDIAEEIVQEVFLKIWEKKEQIDPERDFLPYIKVITQNTVYNTLKKAKRDKALQEKSMPVCRR